MSWEVLVGDCRDVLATLPAASVHTVVTSPPYFGLRDYGTGEWEGGDDACDHLRPPNAKDPTSTLGTPGHMPGANTHQNHAREPWRDACRKCGATRVDRQIGLEPTPDEFVQALVEVFREVRRVLRDDGTVWLNLGDSYAAGGGFAPGAPSNSREAQAERGIRHRSQDKFEASGRTRARGARTAAGGLKQKDLIGIPWAVAFALRADGWYLRSDIIWNKPNPMPESVTDRPTRSHEHIFLLSKSARYFYDSDAIREDGVSVEQTAHNERYAREYETHTHRVQNGVGIQPGNNGNQGIHARPGPGGRNKRDVWTVSTKPYADAHFATFPPDLIEPCVLAGCPERACGACGAPWERIVERTTVRERLSANGDAHVIGKDKVLREQGARKDDLNFSNSHNMPRSPEVRTLGFEPSCDCRSGVSGALNAIRAEHGEGSTQRERHAQYEAAKAAARPESVPGVVLDPFAGAGTTGLVAVRHKRAFIGIELNATYAQMARDRIATDIRLGHRPPQRVVVNPDQGSMFDVLNGAGS